MVWCVGFIYSFAFQWPESIASLFRRRCSLDDATVVAIVAPIREIGSIATNKKNWIEKIALAAWAPFDFAFRVLFSYQRFPANYVMTFCIVDKQSASFYYRMGRYVLSRDENKFVPGSINAEKTVGDLLDEATGLTSKDVLRLQTLVGPNIISVEKPNWLRTLYREFSQSYYIYQTYMLWTWFVYWYVHMALIGTIVRVIGGLTIASFQHANNCALYKLATVDGEVMYVSFYYLIVFH
jgi:Cation transporter/ATPase, N-terminus